MALIDEIWTNLESSNLLAARYDREKEELHIRFKRGGHYKYFDVRESVFEDLLNASSHGKFFHAYIRDTYQYERVE